MQHAPPGAWRGCGKALRFAVSQCVGPVSGLASGRGEPLQSGAFPRRRSWDPWRSGVMPFFYSLTVAGAVPELRC